MRVMIAFGGKRDKGELKFLGGEGEVVAVFRDECEDRRERQVRNTAAMKNETAITARGSLMVGIESRTGGRSLISSPAPAHKGWLTSDITDCRASSKVLEG